MPSAAFIPAAAALDLGITLYAGEGEGRLHEFYLDALNGRLKPVYNYMNDLPGLDDQPTPYLPEAMVRRYGGSVACFDAGRGCPFQCSFCTIINVQGRKSRYRTADDVERLVRANIAQGITRFFITEYRAMLQDVPMDPDMNIYDLEHVCTGHALMTKDEWQRIYNEAWELYYSEDHLETLMKRMVVSGNKPERIWAHALQFAGCIRYEKVLPLQGGYFRRKLRTERRSGLPLESPLIFYPRRAWEIVSTYGPFAWFALRLWVKCRRIKRDSATRRYSDLTLTPVTAHGEDEHLEMFAHAEAAQAAVAKAQREAEARERHQKAVSAAEYGAPTAG